MVTKRAYKPKDDDEFLEQLSFIRFVSGFRYSVVEERWPLIRRAFHGFSVNRLSTAAAADVERIMSARGMILNRGKVADIIKNARVCSEIAEEHGSVLKWIAKVKKQHESDPLLSPSLREALRRFHGIGEVTSGWLESVHTAEKGYVTYTVP